MAVFAGPGTGLGAHLFLALPHQHLAGRNLPGGVRRGLGHGDAPLLHRRRGPAFLCGGGHTDHRCSAAGSSAAHRCADPPPVTPAALRQPLVLSARQPPPLAAFTQQAAVPLWPMMPINWHAVTLTTPKTLPVTAATVLLGLTACAN